MPTPDHAPALLSLASVRGITGDISESSIRRMMKVGSFPQPIALGVRSNGLPARIAWIESEVRQWVADRIAEARSSATPSLPSSSPSKQQSVSPMRERQGTSGSVRRPSGGAA